MNLKNTMLSKRNQKKKLRSTWIPCTVHSDRNKSCGYLRLRGVEGNAWKGMEGNFLYSYLGDSCLGVYIY